MTQIVFKKGKFLVVAMIISEGKVGIHHLLLLGETNEEYQAKRRAVLEYVSITIRGNLNFTVFY